jgi:AraC-like DNA-binding protein
MKKTTRNALQSIGFYRSPNGGAPQPAVIGAEHIFFELITEGAVYAPGERTLQGVGAVFVHRPGQKTVYQTEGQGRYACMIARFMVKRVNPWVEWPRYFPWSEPEEAVRFATEMLHAFHREGQDLGVIGDLVWSQFRYQLDRYQSHPMARGIPPRLAVVLAHMEENYGQALGLDALAARIGLSASHLHAEFRQHLGITPHQYLIGQRMQAAQHQLATTGTPIKAVAAAVGYGNTENFCRSFKKHTGLTAAAYRKKFRFYGA